MNSIKIVFLISLAMMASLNIAAQQPNDYSKNWKAVEAFEKKGLTRSALQEVMKIFDMATAAGNEVQQVKSSMYEMKYRNMVEEDNKENNIFYVDTLIAKTKAPVKNILQSMQAELFQSYLQANRYKFYNRTKLAEERSKDISTWSIEKLNATIAALYKASLKNEILLKNTSLAGMDAILQKGENTRNLRPTLYDFLAHRALAYFMSSENDVIMPAYKFILNDERIFSPVADFIKIKFITKDSTSVYYNALSLFQDILKFHINDPSPDALLDADLLRLGFANDHGIFTNKDKLYEDALKNIETIYIKNEAAAQAMYLRAQLYFTRGNEYDPVSKKETQYEIKRAKELCDIAINGFPKSEGAINCQNLLNMIKMPLLGFQTEKVNIPGQPFRSLVKYKNINTLHLRIIKTSREEIERINQLGYEASWNEVINLQVLRSWDVNLPNLQDYQEHAAEIKVDALLPGTYYILGSINADFSLSKNIISRQVTYISNISYISNNKDELYVLNRDNGQPLANATVQLWQQVYNNGARKYENAKKEKYSTDVNGYVKLKIGKDYYNSSIQVKYLSDELFLDDNIIAYYYNSYTPPSIKRTFLFTDRSIYRPGQTIYFKGIVVSTDSASKKSSVAPGYKTTITLYDANSRKISSLDLRSGEYGSFSGNFKLPEGLLNGLFYLKDSIDNSTQYFSVEEYKRPKFFVEVNKPTGTYRLQDSILVKGKAKAYAGNNIDGAKVTYRVVRKVRYPIWWGWGSYYGRGKSIYPSSSEEMEITNGETTTNANGEFFVTFKAIPDENVDRKGQPVFHYEINADITDINGETRSGNTTVAVAYQMLQLDIVSADKMEADSIQRIKIKSSNLNGLFEKTTVNVALYKLRSPRLIFRERYWEMPDQFMMSYDEYKTNFPYDIYSDEDQMSKWPIGDIGVSITDTTTQSGEFALRNGQLRTGWYKLIATTKDKYGEEVSAEKYILLTDGNGFVSEDKSAINVKVSNATAEPGEKISYNISTDLDKIWLIQNLSKTGSPTSTSYQNITASSPYTNEIAVTESDRGGMNMNYAFVHHNRVYTGAEYFNIPWSNKDLHISYETFRDKLLPGSEEKWKIKISGNKTEKVAAETLISMYDASLDQFKPHRWVSLKSLWPVNSENISWRAGGFTAVSSDEFSRVTYAGFSQRPKSYDALANYGWNENYYFYNRIRLRGESAAAPMANGNDKMQEVVVTSAFQTKRSLRDDTSIQQGKERKNATDTVSIKQEEKQTQNNNVQIRKNFNETAFFFPSLLTDENGNVEFSFTIPEALTEWKMMTLAHSKELASGYSEKTVITQKPLMVQPNAPRFLREGDQMEFSAKIVNLSEKELTGTAQLELFDAANNKPVDGWFKNVFPSQYFTVPAGQSVSVKFPIGIPSNFNSALTYRIKAVAKDADFSDGEEAALPVLTNRTLVTESMPLNMRNETTKNFKFEKLLNSGKSETLSNHAVTVEYTSNPAWYAVQALPFLMEYPYECAEQTFNRYYANALAGFIANASPKIKAIFETWKTLDTAALMSNLQKNEELKSVLLQETPWVMEAQNENQQKKNIALLFDMVRMAKEKNSAFNKLKEMQGENGGFTWLKGGPDDRYMTQYIITGIGHLFKLNALTADDMALLKTVIDKAIPYLDARIKEEYDYLLKHKIILKNNNLSATAIQYLYMRSFFNQYKISAASQTAYNYYRGQSQKYWLSHSKYMQAMIALSLQRTDDNKTPFAIIRSLKENAIYKEEMGMYWKDLAGGGYYWYQAPIESQAMMIEAFTDIDKDNKTIDDLKTWLLKQKQTQNWKTTRATAEACYALLLNGSSWLSEEKTVTINLGSTVIKSTDNATEAGTGYFKKTIEAEKVKAAMGNITISVSSSTDKPINHSTTSWGAVYWQYFENLDKITSAETPLKLVKKLFIEKNSDRGPVLKALNDGDELHIGDKVKVRIELRVDRDMEYVHMKDMRASCMEPVNVISQYKWQGGLGYYESTRDASTNFFFGWLARGTYVFEYPMFVTHSGDFSNGITTIQCMYAPEFTSHSEGIRVNVK
ncbi:MAG: alpha-2-macroglobulin family protein [Ferruginibacter sp.]